MLRCELIELKDMSHKKVSKEFDTALAAGLKLVDHVKMISSGRNETLGRFWNWSELYN